MAHRAEVRGVTLTGKMAAAGGAGREEEDEWDGDDASDSGDSVKVLSAPTTVAGVKRKRKEGRGRPRKDGNERFEELIQMFPEIQQTPRSRELYERTHKVVCTVCRRTLKASKASNFASHRETSDHMSAASAKSGHKAVGTFFLQPPAPVAVDEDLVLDARALLATAAVAHATPDNIAELYSGAQMEVAQSLATMGRGLTAGGTVDDSLDRGALLLKNEIRRQLAGKNMCIVIDEATTRLAGYKRPMAVLLGCSAVGKPILAKLLFDCPEADAAASAIRAVLAEYNVDITTHVTCLVGDNAALVDAIASKLELPRLRCIPHCLHLVFKKGTAVFKEWEAVTRVLSSTLTAGGTPYRLHALDGSGLQGSRLRGNPLRWGQMLRISTYLLEELGDWAVAGVYEKVREVIGTDKSFHAAVAEEVSEGDSDNEDGDRDDCELLLCVNAAAAPL